MKNMTIKYMNYDEIHDEIFIPDVEDAIYHIGDIKFTIIEEEIVRMQLNESGEWIEC